MPVREKGKKRKVLTNKLTIDELHKSKYNEIENIENTRREYEEEISTIKAELNLLRKNTLAPSGIPKMNIEYKIWQLEDRIEHLQAEIDDLHNKERKYLLHSSKILKNYYKMVKAEEETIKQLHEADFENNNKSKRGRKKPNITTTTVISSVKFSIFDKLDAASSNKSNIGTNSSTNSRDNNDTNSNSNSNVDTNTPLNNEVPNKQKLSTGSFNKLYNKYMKVIDPKYIKKFENTVLNICKNCNTDMVLNHNTGLFNCQNCGLCKNVIIDTDKQNHKEPPKEMTSFSYRRINHLNEILSQIQGKETTDIPKEIYEEIHNELRKERFTDISKLTTDKLKKVLKKIGRSKYYEHIPYMVIQMGGIPPPVISPEVEEIIRDIFLKMQHPFNNCEKERTNFLTYTGVLYKIFELLDMDHYLKNFKFLKDDKKQYYQEQIWKQICEELGWEFIPSS
jgi:ribosomal protein L37AE/L43A